MPSPRSAGLIAVVTAMTSVAIGFPHGTVAAVARAQAPGGVGSAVLATADKEPGTLTELRRQAQRAYRELDEATKVLHARQKLLNSSQRKLAQKLTQLQATTQELNRLRQPLAQLVSSIYQGSAGAGVSPVFVGGDPSAALRTMSDMNYLALGRSSVLEDANRLLRRQKQIAAEAEELRAANLLHEAQVSAEIEALRSRSAKLVKNLTRSLVRLGVKIGKANSGGCDPTRIDVAAQYPNGLLPQNILCPLPQRGEVLRADAAIAFADLNLAYQRRFGKPMCVSDSYRSLAEQQAVFYRRPGLAATPGKSNHGLGLAVDLCGGVQIFRSPQFNWLEQNGKRYGWIHPDWAYRSPFEPWHWEYDPELGAGL